jgi:hypothetical protein
VKMPIKAIEHEGIDWVLLDQDEVRYHDLIVNPTLSYMRILAVKTCRIVHRVYSQLF